jgi:hypothetical protein
MKLPFVSRSKYEYQVGYGKGIEQGLKAQIESLSSKYDQIFDRWSNLVDHVVKMKHEGFELPQELPDIEVAEIPENVRGAILERSAPGTQTYKELHGWAVEQLRIGSEESEICETILNGAQF